MQSDGSRRYYLVIGLQRIGSCIQVPCQLHTYTTLLRSVRWLWMLGTGSLLRLGCTSLNLEAFAGGLTCSCWI